MGLHPDARSARQPAPSRGPRHVVDPTSAAFTLTNLTREPTIYLVDECDDPDDERACLHAVYAAIFEDQLDGWWRDRATWPTPRSLAVFRNWFDCQFHSTLIDLADEPVIEEEI